MNEAELNELRDWSEVGDLNADEAINIKKLRDFCDKPFTREDFIRFIDNEMFSSAKKFANISPDDGVDKFRMERCYIRFLTSLKGIVLYPKQIKKAAIGALKGL